MKYRAMTKNELAAAAGVSPKVLSRWLNNDEDFLAIKGVTKNCHVLPATAVQYACEEYGIDPENLP